MAQEEVECPRCSVTNPSGNNYCGTCGEPLFATTSLQKADLKKLEESAADLFEDLSEEKSQAPVDACVLAGAILERPVKVPRERALTIGRDRINDVVIPALFVSRYHAEIRRDDGTTRIRDMGSRNGTLVNGKPTTTRTLTDGDRISIGIFDLFFRELPADQDETTIEYPNEFIANLSQISMREVIQLLVLNRKTGKLSIRNGGGESALYFEKGWIVNALTPSTKGADAAMDVIRLPKGIVRYSGAPVRCPQVITESPAQLVRTALNLT